MPYSLVHTELAFDIQISLPYKEEDFIAFLVGNIFVDANNLLSLAGYDMSRAKTHYYEGGAYETIDFVECFLAHEGVNMNPFMRGYYYHLIVDMVWRDSIMIVHAYESIEKERLYQISRKLHSFRDLKKLKNDIGVLEIIEKMRHFRFEASSLPKIFQDIPSGELNHILNTMIDFMVGKDIFIKKSESSDDYIIRDGELLIKDKNLEKKVLETFSYETYEELKKIALNEFQLKVLSKIR